jgi:RNA polymerase sigma-70 factor, ECF subfamily
VGYSVWFNTGTHLKNFEELVKENTARILAVSLKILRNQAEAEDNTQDTFLKAWQKQDQFKGESTFSTWLTRIAINNALMRIRKVRRRVPTLNFCELDTAQSDFVLQFYSQDPSPERQYAAKELVVPILEELSPKLRRAILLRAIEGMTDREIAKKLGIKKNTVKARWFRAREQAVAKAKELGA